MSTNTPPPIPDAPPEKSIQAIKASLRCFAYSLIGLVPVVGIPFSVAAMVQCRKLERATRAGWNPAAPYLRAAGRIAPLGFLTTAACLVVVCIVVPGFWEGLTSCASGST